MAYYNDRKPGFWNTVRHYTYGYCLEVYRAMKVETAKLPEEERRAAGSWLRFWFNVVCHGCCVEDYYEMQMYNHSFSYNYRLITYDRKNRLLAKLNDKRYINRFRDKSEFYKYYGHLMGREQIKTGCTFEEFEVFAKRHGSFFAKPIDQCEGYGVRRIDTDEATDMRALFDELTAMNMVFEPVIKNHPVIAAFHPGSLNTLRVCTMREGDEVNVFAAFLRTGNGGVMDNQSSGGLAAAIDVKTGIVTSPGIDLRNHKHTCHPMSGICYPGFVIPKWDEVVEFVKKAANITPQVRYVGWDVAITPDSIILIEGNDDGSLRHVQNSLERPLRPLFKSIIKRTVG